jgi:site-specific DNA-cytosine methylase
VNELALFAGAGGGILGGKMLGWRTVCAVEWEPYAASVLAARQNEGFLESFPIWDDVCSFNGRPWRGIVDVVSGGFPCQDISAAGKGAGIDGERSGMWGEMARIIHEVRPKFVFVENSPMLTSRGLGRVLGDLASMGFDARWGVLGAADVGANHKRERIWIVAHSNKYSNIATQRRSDEETNSMESINWSINCSTWQFGRTSNEIGKNSMRGYAQTHNVANTSSKNVERQREVSFGIKQKFGNIGNESWWNVSSFAK